jgi:hypothetical protein
MQVISCHPDRDLAYSGHGKRRLDCIGSMGKLRLTVWEIATASIGELIDLLDP